MEIKDWISLAAAIAASLAAIASWVSVIRSSNAAKEMYEEKHLSVQPFFHAVQIEHNKGSQKGNLSI